MTTTLTATQIAAAYDLNGRSFRRYLRSVDRIAGKGHTHVFTGVRSTATVATVRAYLNSQLGKDDKALTVAETKARIVADAVAAIDKANADAKAKATDKAKADKAKVAKAKAAPKGKGKGRKAQAKAEAIANDSVVANADDDEIDAAIAEALGSAV